MSFNPETEIANSEWLYRAIPDLPNFWKPEFSRPSSALFKTNTDGISVDRDGDRNEQEIIAVFCQKKPDHGLGKLNAGFVKEIPLIIKQDPIENNPYHALILETDGTADIKSSKTKKLAKEITVIQAPETYR